MNDTEKQKYSEYRKLMKYKKYFLGFPVLFFISCFFLSSFFDISIVIIGVILVIYSYFSSFIFLAKNVCPWCKMPFFLFGSKGLDGNGISFIFQKKCLHCKRPNQEQDTFKNI